MDIPSGVNVAGRSQWPKSWFGIGKMFVYWRVDHQNGIFLEILI